MNDEQTVITQLLKDLNEVKFQLLKATEPSPKTFTENKSLNLFLSLDESR